MTSSLKKVLLAGTVSLLLMAFQCGKDEPGPFTSNTLRVTISPGPVFSLNDTIWVSGRVSSNLFDESIRDSVRNENAAVRDHFGLLRLQEAADGNNAIPALVDFDWVVRTGSVEAPDFQAACEASDLVVRVPLTPEGESYAYEIGLLPRSAGDFSLNWLVSGEITNPDRNLQILSSYPVGGLRDYLAANTCGEAFLRTEVGEIGRNFFFSVQ